MSDKLIKTLQTSLTQLGYDPGPENGLWGDRTEAAVVAFQQDHGLKPDGIPGTRTNHVLEEAVRMLNVPFPDIESLPGRNRSSAERKLTGDTLVKILQNRGYTLDRLDRVQLVGIRGYRGGKAVPNDFNEYNDTLIILQPTLRWQLAHRFKASVDPGHLREPNPRGVAHLIPGSYLYRMGLHHGEEPALVQAGEVKVMRYFDEEPERIDPFEDSGWFGINIHRGGMSPRVGGWSAGCQIIHGSQWERFIGIVQRAADHGQEVFRYHLIEGWQVDRVL